MFLAVSRVFRGIMECSTRVPRLFRAVPGCSGLFRGVPGIFRGVPGVFRGVPGFTGTPQKIPNYFRVVLYISVVAVNERRFKFIQANSQ